VRLGETLQGAGARFKDHGQIWFDSRLPGAEGGLENGMQQNLAFHRVYFSWQIHNQAEVNI
jgi:hypothetical protein